MPRMGMALRAETLWGLAFAALLAALTGCARQTRFEETLCRGTGGDPAIVAELFFGQNISGRDPVSDAEWAQFVAQAIIPRFSRGFTVLDGAGQWLDPRTHTVEAEKTKILVVSAEANEESLGRLRQIADLYKVRFDQRSVGLVVMNACSSF